MSQPRQHFHTFDALRFFAFLKVFLLHLPVPDNFPVFNFLRSGGGIGVAFFFSLSGFLISYILIKEKVNEGKIDLWKFFIRRGLRIWPLYYLLVILIFVLPFSIKNTIGLEGGGYELDWRYSFSFLENYKMIIMDSFPKTSPLNVFWSLCIEEHFYLLWMVVISLLPLKKLPHAFVFFIVLANLYRLFIQPLYHNSLILSNDLISNLDLFAMSGLVAYFVVTKYEEFIRFINSIPNGVKSCFVVLVIGTVVYQDTLFPAGNPIIAIVRTTITALLFALLISIFIPPDSKLRIGDGNLLSRLGKISYGLYVYHIIFIHVLLQYYQAHHLALENWPVLFGYIAITFGATIVISYLSYRYFEMPILKLRERWKKTASVPT
jgi:peptidoglycan/LPS O-acetylase OafA/YrhL